ncbi:cobalamin B12-binding domain-containing protein [Falsiroseomonas sp. HW251]|uniref:cobalamin B12-binding domain-containing protein n=1 Tax=Falsiroseomonas sp. HW251 TaxID=3390998 RepID=UPI003D31CF61
MTDSASTSLTAYSDGPSGSRDFPFDLDDLATPVGRPAEQRRVALLARALESEVIPRLVLARQNAAAPSYRDDRAIAPTAEDVRTLAEPVLRGDLQAAMAGVAALRARNLPLERIYLEVLAPVARLLGTMWQEDRCDFTAVTVGLCCLQQLLLENSGSFGPRPGRRDGHRRILLAPVPGEQHSFGLVMVGEFFRRQGWDVCSGTGASARELVATTRKQWFSMIGLSMSCESRLQPLASLIHEIRRASRNPQIGVLVGGGLFMEQPELATLVGADATATDGQQAVLKAETLLALLAPEA